MAKKPPVVPKQFNSARGVTLKWSLAVPDSEFSFPFVQGMCDRMGVSYFVYGKVANSFPATLDALACLAQRLEKYRETHNTEYLIDAANFAMIEFMHPSFRDAHFTPTDRSGSPGRKKKSGTITMKHNDDILP